MVDYSFSLRTLMVPAVLATLLLAGCEVQESDLSSRALQPLSQDMLETLELKHMARESPILMRLFKEEAELEVWKKDDSGRFALLKTYPICRWSGELGPKLQQGDRQAPEGFYTIRPEQFNPHSQYYLSFDLGYPNAFDRAHGRTGSNLMVHGDCASAGCYAMTDEQISEIYALARESFFGGQQSLQVQAYPFRMTPMNMAKHRDNLNMSFWRILKEGNDYFEVTKLEPRVDVCERRYVFDAVIPGGAAGAFNPSGTCPPYHVRSDIESGVTEKQRKDNIAIAELIDRGTPTVPVRTGTDGRTNPVFLPKISHVDAYSGSPSSEETGGASSPISRLFGSWFGLSETGSTPKEASLPESRSFLSRLFGGTREKTWEATTQSAPRAAKPVLRRTRIAASKPGPKLKPLPDPPARPLGSQAAQEETGKQEAERGGLLVGAQPVVPAGGFQSR